MTYEEEIVPITSTCRSCKQPIRWVVMEASRARMPLDPEPCADGTIDLAGDNRAAVLCAYDAEMARAAGRQLYRSHFSTCLDARSHRRARS